MDKLDKKRNEIRSRREKRLNKKQFSTMACKIKFDGKTLTIKGMKYIVSLLLLIFSLGCGYMLILKDIPLIIQISVGASSLFLFYGFLDSLFSKSFFQYDIYSNYMLVKRTSLSHKVTYQGEAEGNYKVVKKHASKGRNSSISLYQVCIRLDLADAVLFYPLENLCYDEESVEIKINEWKKKLSRT